MKTLTKNKTKGVRTMPASYGLLCREVWLPRPIRDETDYRAALSAIEPLWGHEEAMNQDQSDWFTLVANLLAQYEDSASKPDPVPSFAERLTGLLHAHDMSAADLARLLGLDASMGSKIINGTRHLTVSHVLTLSNHFALPADYFLIR